MARRSLPVGLLLLAAVSQARAQAPAWTLVAPVGGSNCFLNATATDASGNVFVTGTFTGQATFGSTVLTSVGANDLFVAKYVPGTGTWAWAQSGGGTGSDVGSGLAVSGGAVYVVGSLTNNLANAAGVLLGGTGPGSSSVRVNGASATSSQDALLAKYLDNGSSATLAWTQVGGGTSFDYGQRVAVSGSSVYLLSSIANDTSNSNAVLLGGGGTTPGTTTVRGATTQANQDLVLAKYVDNGPSASLGWTQVAGGASPDFAKGLAVRGTSVYVLGTSYAAQPAGQGVFFGSNGTTAGTLEQPGASPAFSTDWVLAKYQDNGATGSYVWSQVGGGTALDFSQDLVLGAGSSLYAVGTITNSSANASQVLFGGSRTAAGTVPVSGATATNSQDVLVVKYLDNGTAASVAWTQVGGGTDTEYAMSLGVSGSSVFVTGAYVNNSVNTKAVVFGGNGTAPGTVTVPGVTTTAAADVFVAKYTDQGSSATLATVQTGGSAGDDVGQSLTLTGKDVYVAANVGAPATFGSLALAGASQTSLGALLRLSDPLLLPTRAAAGTGPAFTLWPNPARGAATLAGLAPGTLVQVLDALGRPVATVTTNAGGTAPLAGLAPGLYLVRAGGSTARLAVE